MASDAEKNGLRVRIDAMAKLCGNMSRLAKRAAVRDSTLRMAYARGSVSTRIAAKLAKAMGKPVAWVLTGEDSADSSAAIPTYRTGGGGTHWVVGEDAKAYSTKIPPNLIGFRVDGDSMEPLARHGQVVLALRGVLPKDGDLAVVQLVDHGIHMFRRVSIRGTQWILTPINPGHTAEVYPKRQIDLAGTMKVWGVKF